MQPVSGRMEKRKIRTIYTNVITNRHEVYTGLTINIYVCTYDKINRYLPRAGRAEDVGAQ